MIQWLDSHIVTNVFQMQETSFVLYIPLKYAPQQTTHLANKRKRELIFLEYLLHSKQTPQEVK